MKIYISGPMTGHPELNKKAFDNARQRLKNLGHKFVCPHDVSLTVDKRFSKLGIVAEYSDYMKADILVLLNDCDAILMLDGWKHSRGARLEYMVAKVCGLKIFFEKTT